MATTTAPQQAAPASPGPMKRIILIVLIALIAAGAAGAGVWFFMSKRAPVAVSAEAAPAQSAVPLFFPLESMTVNLQSDDGQQHFLRIGLTLKLGDAGTQQALTDHMPEVRSRILLALSNKQPRRTRAARRQARARRRAEEADHRADRAGRRTDPRAGRAVHRVRRAVT
ncbi:flagellar FliL protein [Paraburkholderia youngii]